MNLAAMKARIADELGDRSDLAGQIANAIATAISAYQSERFNFNETRDITFNTVAAQEFYTSVDNENIPTLMAIDYVTITIGTTVNTLSRYEPEAVELLSEGAQNGQPYAYTYYNKTLRLFPMPSGVYAIRVVAHRNLNPPATDDELDNPWMTDAELLIRSRAKYELAIHVLNDGSLAEAMSPDPAPTGSPGHVTYREFLRLKGRANKQLGRGVISPMPF